MASIFTPGRTILLFGNLMYGFGAFYFHFNETQVYNPRWPPHAKFHNGQTMSMAVCLAATSTYFAFRPTLTNSAISAKDSIFEAAIIGSLYCFTGISAIFYPGTAWVDPDINLPPAQKFVFPGILAVIWTGYASEIVRLMKEKMD